MNRQVLVSGCSGKTGYASPQEAHRQVRHRAKRQKNRRDNRGKTHAYKCDHCGRWHIGTSAFA